MMIAIHIFLLRIVAQVKALNNKEEDKWELVCCDFLM